MRKHLLHAIILCSCLILTQLLVLRPVKAAAGEGISRSTGDAVAKAGKLATTSGTRHPITISKLRFFTKAFGNVVQGKKHDLVFFLEAILPSSCMPPADLHTPVPAGRSP